MSDKRRGLGRGLGALIPSSASANASGTGSAPSRPVDLFFPEARKRTPDAALTEETTEATEARAGEDDGVFPRDRCPGATARTAELPRGRDCCVGWKA